MFKKAKDLFAICDEEGIQQQLLHHRLDHDGFDVAFSTASPGKFIEYYLHDPAPIVLFNKKANSKTPRYMVKKIKQPLHPLSVICYNSEPDEKLCREMKTKFDTDIYFCNGQLEGIMHTVEELTKNNHTKKYDDAHPHLPEGHPFYEIVNNTVYFQILRELANGKSSKQIEGITGHTTNTINSYITKMHESCGFKTTHEMIYKATKAGII